MSICHHCLHLLKNMAVTSISAGVVARCSTSWSNLAETHLVRLLLRHMATQAHPEKREKLSRQAAKEEKHAVYEKFPFLQTKTSKRQVYVLNESLADTIVKSVRENQIDPDVLLLEANPGCGVLTKALLKAGVKHIVLSESLKDFIPHIQASLTSGDIFQDLQKQHKSNILAIYNWDYLSTWRQTHDGDEAEKGKKVSEDKLASLVPHKKWTEGPPLSMVAVAAEDKEHSFLVHLVMSCARQHGLFTFGRPEYFLVISPHSYRKLLVAKMKTPMSSYYNPLGIVLHMVFDIQLCAELPAWKFIPRFPEKRRQVIQGSELNVSSSLRYLVRLWPHKEHNLPLSEVPAFYSFLRQVMHKKKVRLIPKMEQLVPGCGVHLIMMHFTMMMLVTDVSPSQYVTIFKAMQTWPEYHGSPLKQILTDSDVSHTVEENVEDAQRQS